MGSRLRENPSRLLECWCEVVGPQGKDRPPWLLQKFPSSYNDQEILKGVPQFAFPCTFDRSTVQHFSFVLTSLDSKWTYGFCRHAPGQDTALVLLSYLPWHQTFYKLLNHLAELMTNDRTSDLTACLQSAYRAPVPHPGSDITIPYATNKFFVGHCPDHRRLPTIPENRNLSEYYNAIDANNMVEVFASMLHERRIIVVSRRVSRLSACVQAANALIYPMQWQHIFIPVLPQHLTDYLLAPMPFLIGVSSSLLSKVQMDDVGEAVILDADNNTVRNPFTDAQALPEEVSQALRRNLKAANNALGDGVARAFLRALVQLIGNYKEALQFREQDKRITFSREKFVSSRPAHYQPFIEKMLELQILQQFIEDRLDRLNSGSQTSDEFELEASMYCEKAGGGKVKQQYRQFVTSVRKEGGAIVKTMKSKTNPAVKSAVKTVTKGGKQVKERSRQTYKDLRGKLKDLQLPPPRPEDGAPPWLNGEGMPQKPQSAPSSPTHSIRHRGRTAFDTPPGFSARTTYKRSSELNAREDSRPRKYELIESGSGGGLMSPGSTDSLSTPSPQSLDLMGEMDEILRAKLGHEAEDEDDQDDDSLQSSESSDSSSYRLSLGSESATGSTNTVMAAHRDQPVTPSDTPSSSSSQLASRKDGSAQDLIFLESPQDEIFDPLLSKDLPRSPSSARLPLSTSASSSKIPSTSFLHGGKIPLSTSASSSKIPSTSSARLSTSTKPSSSSSTKPLHATPGSWSRPASSTSSGGNLLARPNHPPPSIPSSADAAAKSAPILPGVGEGEHPLPPSLSAPCLPDPANLPAPINTTGLPNATPTAPQTRLHNYQAYRPYSSLQTCLGATVSCQNPLYNQHHPPAGLPTSTRAGSAAAAFAAKMLSPETEVAAKPGQYVQIELPFASSRTTAGQNVAITNQAASVTPQRPPRLSQKDLLGDFSKDFQKLMVNSHTMSNDTATTQPTTATTTTTQPTTTTTQPTTTTTQPTTATTTNNATTNKIPADQGMERKGEGSWATFD